jgi:hypothetical protein
MLTPQFVPLQALPPPQFVPVKVLSPPVMFVHTAMQVGLVHGTYSYTRLQARMAPPKVNNTHAGVPCTRGSLRDPVKLTKKKRQKLIKPPTYCTYCFNNACSQQKMARLAGSCAALMVSVNDAAQHAGIRV